MSHTTFLRDGWYAIHDGSPTDSSNILLREEGTDQEVTVPFGVLKDLVASEVRKYRIRVLEGMSTESILS